MTAKRTMDEFRADKVLYASELNDRRNSSLALANRLAAGVVAAL